MDQLKEIEINITLHTTGGTYVRELTLAKPSENNIDDFLQDVQDVMLEGLMLDND